MHSVVAFVDDEKTGYRLLRDLVQLHASLGMCQGKLSDKLKEDADESLIDMSG